MHREKLKKLLSSYQITFDEDLEILNRFSAFVDSQSDCFERTLSVGHITGSAWVVDKEREHVLFTYHRKLDMWLQLGGHCDGDSDVYSVALTEAKEESGLVALNAVSKDIFDLDIHMIPKYKNTDEHYHYDVRFIFEADLSDELIISKESKDLSWIHIDEIKNHTNESSISRMVNKLKKLNEV